MSKTLVFLAALLTSSAVFGAFSAYPKGPNERLTPGSLCRNADTYRYPERIAYCSRDVERSLKAHIIMKYDRDLGFQIGSMDRNRFKIDHLIPLCAGGSNEESNLWPQHESIYKITDPLEPEICAKMAKGKLKQADAVALILHAKTHLEDVQATLDYLRRL